MRPWPYRSITVLGYGHAYPVFGVFFRHPVATDAKQNPDKMIGLEVMKHSVAIWKFLDGQVGLSMKWERLAEPQT
jgi:hypothetical protein